MRYTGRDNISQPGVTTHYLECDHCGHEQISNATAPNVPEIACNRCKKKQGVLRYGS